MSVERHEVRLPRPFFVIATQNPVELEGTFPLPEAQLDRFLMRISIGYPEVEEERAMLRRFRTDAPLESIERVVSPEQMTGLIAAVRRVHVSDAVEDYLLRIIRATRNHATIEVGASPRAALALVRAAQAFAAVEGRDFVRPDDVREMAEPVLAHRVIATAEAELLGKSTLELIADIVASVDVPVESGNVV